MYRGVLAANGKEVAVKVQVSKDLGTCQLPLKLNSLTILPLELAAPGNLVGDRS